MSLISFTPVVDGTTIVASGVNTPFSIIYNDYNGNITNANIASNAAIDYSKLNAPLALGYAQITANISTTATSAAQATGLTTTVTIPSGSRRIKITAYIPQFTNSNATNGSVLTIWDGTVGSGTQLTSGTMVSPNGATTGIPMNVIASVTPSAGSKTYNVGFHNTAATTTTIACSATAPAFILVEAI